MSDLNILIIKYACNMYSDFDMPVWKCCEKYLLELGMEENLAYNTALELADYYCNNYWKF